jgi:ABC-type bacteriocin/lantibiotic exporter with double-glycine peptidase domain
MMIFYLVIMIRYSFLLSLVGICTILLNLILSRVISEKRINLTRVQTRDQGMLMGTTASGVEMIETIKGSGSENGFFRKWAGYQASVNTQTVKYARLQQYLGSLPQLLTTLSNYTELIAEAAELNYIQPSDIEVLKQWRANPAEWGVVR